MKTDEPSPRAILELGLGFWASKTLLSAVELGVFTTLAPKGVTEEEAVEFTRGFFQAGLDAL